MTNKPFPSKGLNIRIRFKGIYRVWGSGINKPLPFKGLNIAIIITIPTKRSGLIHQGYTLYPVKTN